MGQKTGSPPLYLVPSTLEPRSPKFAHDAALRLEESREMLLQGGHTETVHLLDIVLLQLRMQLRGVSAAELNALCSALSDPAAGQRRDADGA